jgi:hypothetical protein
MSLNKRLISVEGTPAVEDAFQTVLYTGNRPSNVTVNTFGFSPDLVAIKDRDNADHWSVLDTTRGQNVIGFNQTGAQEGFSGGFEFTSGGFIVKNTGQANTNGANLCSWGWRANGGTTSSNTDGTLTSTVQANQDAGFSIVKWTGTGANADIGHGLGSEPKFIIIKGIEATGEWLTWHTGYGGGDKYIYLNQTGAVGTQSQFFRALPTSSVFKIGNHGDINGSGNDSIAYCWSEIAGYSKFGSYTGNGSTTGPTITLGFAPGLLIFRKTAGDRWIIADNKRDTSNPNDKFLDLQDTHAESTLGLTGGVDFLSNGFQLKTTDGGGNADGQEYVYMAWREAP